jgi:hypothetical protein
MAGPMAETVVAMLLNTGLRVDPPVKLTGPRGGGPSNAIRPSGCTVTNRRMWRRRRCRRRQLSTGMPSSRLMRSAGYSKPVAAALGKCDCTVSMSKTDGLGWRLGCWHRTFVGTGLRDGGHAVGARTCLPRAWHPPRGPAGPGVQHPRPSLLRRVRVYSGGSRTRERTRCRAVGERAGGHEILNAGDHES